MKNQRKKKFTTVPIVLWANIHPDRYKHTPLQEQKYTLTGTNSGMVTHLEFPCVMSPGRHSQVEQERFLRFWLLPQLWQLLLPLPVQFSLLILCELPDRWQGLHSTIAQGKKKFYFGCQIIIIHFDRNTKQYQHKLQTSLHTSSALSKMIFQKKIHDSSICKEQVWCIWRYFSLSNFRIYFYKNSMLVSYQIIH